MNRVEIIGRITQDPEASYNPNTQNAFCRFSVAIDRGKDRQGNDLGADFPSIVCFGKTAENVERFLSKGLMVAVTGQIRTGKYEKDGRVIYTTDVYADRVEFLEWKDDKDSGSGSKKTGQKPQNEQIQGFTQLSDDDIPF